MDFFVGTLLLAGMRYYSNINRLAGRCSPPPPPSRFVQKVHGNKQLRPILQGAVPLGLLEPQNNVKVTKGSINWNSRKPVKTPHAPYYPWLILNSELFFGQNISHRVVASIVENYSINLFCDRHFLLYMYTLLYTYNIICCRVPHKYSPVQPLLLTQRILGHRN